VPILFPWTLWPPLWRSLAASRRGPVEPAARFALACAVPGLIVFSLISGKQVHYLMPLLPAFAILVGTACQGAEGATRAWDTIVPAGLLALGGLLLLAARYLYGPEWATGISAWWGLMLLIGAALLALQRRTQQQVIALSLASPALVILVHLAAGKVASRIYDLRPAAAFLREAESDHRPIAYVGRYSGQFHFLGRLERPFDEVTPEQLPRWTADHPTGLVIRNDRSAAESAGAP
jgi:4-amino-4-deoxy-L-arabinose transferase-like glycosyltransferase